MKTTSLLSLLLAVATAVSAIPIEADTADVLQRSDADLDTTDFDTFDSGSFDIGEDALDKRAGAHIVLHNSLGKALSYQLNDGGAQKTLGKGKSVHLPYPALNAGGYKIYLRHPGHNGFFLAEYALGSDAGGNKVYYNFSKAGSAVDPFNGSKKSFTPLSHKGELGYNCVPIHCGKDSKDRCSAMNGERIAERSNGKFPVGSCPANTSLKVTIG